MQVPGNVSVDPTVANQSEFSLLSACGRVGKYVFTVVENALRRAGDILLFRGLRKSKNSQLIQAQQTNGVRATGYEQSINKDSLHSPKEALQLEPMNSDIQSLNNKKVKIKDEDTIGSESNEDELSAELVKVQKEIKWYSEKEHRFEPGCEHAKHFKNKREAAEARALDIMKALASIGGHNYNGGFFY